MKFSFLLFSVTTLLYLLHASYEERAFFGDGVTYFINMVEKGGGGWHEPSRRIAHIIIKIPAALAIKAGITDLHFLARLYSMSLLLFPLLFTCISYWCLPQDKKHLFIYPVMIYLAGITAGSFYPIGEAQFGATYFWIIAFLLLYNPMTLLFPKILIFALCLPVILVHESYIFLGFLLFLICAYRYKASLSKSDQIFFILLCAWFIVVILLNLYNVIEPRSPVNRANFLKATITFRFLGDFPALISHGLWKINGPAFLGLFALMSIFLSILLCYKKYTGIFLKVVVLACSLYICLDIFLAYDTFWPSFHVAARAHGAILSFIIFPLMLYIESYAFQKLMVASKGIFIIIIMMSLAQMIWHTGATLHWSRFLIAMDNDLSRTTGLISFNDASISSNYINGRPIKRIAHFGATIPCLSISRAENGIVKAIIDYPRKIHWQPCNPHIPDKLPQLPGFNYDPFIQALQSARY